MEIEELIKIVWEWPYLMPIVSIFIMAIIGIPISIKAYKKKNKKTLPGLWTALGILGTFSSLALTFLFIDINNNEEISGLTQKLATAFITSILGIVVAQIINFNISKEEKEESKKIEYLKEPPEKLLYDLRNIAREQHETNNKSNQVIADLLHELKGLRTDFGNLAGTVTSEFSNTMQALNDNIKNDVVELNRNLVDHTKELQLNFKSLVESSGKKFEENHLENAELLKTNLANINELFKSDVEAFQSKLIENMNTSLNQQKDLQLQSLNDQKEEFQKSFHELRELRVQTKGDAETFVASIEAGRREAVQKTEEITQQINHQFSSLLENIKELQDTTEKSVNASSKRLQDAVELYDEQKNNQSQILEKVEGQINQIDQLIEERSREYEKFNHYEERTDALADNLDLLTNATGVIKEWIESQKHNYHVQEN